MGPAPLLHACTKAITAVLLLALSRLVSTQPQVAALQMLQKPCSMHAANWRVSSSCCEWVWAAALSGACTHLIIDATLLWILEAIICLVDLLERICITTCRTITRFLAVQDPPCNACSVGTIHTLVWMVLQCKLAVGLPQLLWCGILADSKQLIVPTAVALLWARASWHASHALKAPERKATKHSCKLCL